MIIVPFSIEHLSLFLYSMIWIASCFSVAWFNVCFFRALDMKMPKPWLAFFYFTVLDSFPKEYRYQNRGAFIARIGD